VVTHDLDLMRKVADTVMYLYKGEAIYFGPVSELDHCDNPHVKQFLAMDRVEIHGKIDEG
jgi:phospholipid/cholesterol/gamma-HCH transport system ATP-binding protein